MLLDLLFAEFQGGTAPGLLIVSDSGNEIIPQSLPLNCINQYMIGNIAILKAQFFDQNKNPVDPTDITLFVRNPDYTEEAFNYGSSAITRDATGVYHFDLPLTKSGYYNYRWVAGGNYVAANDSQLESIPSFYEE